MYERRLIEKYLQEKGKCPVTEQTMSKDDLISVHGTFLPSIIFGFNLFFCLSCQPVYPCETAHRHFAALLDGSISE